MRILALNYEFPPLGGGSANETFYYFKQFSKFNDIEIDLITASVDKYRIEEFASNIRIHYLDIGKGGDIHYQSMKDLLKYSYKGLRYAKKLIKKEKFDLVHAIFGIPCGYMAMRLGLPYIVRLQGSDVPFYSERFYWMDKVLFRALSEKIWRKSVKTIANSKGLKELGDQHVRGVEVGVIPNGVNIHEFHPRKNYIPSKRKILISTGRLIERKGYQFLIEALGGMNEGFLVRLIGDGPMMDDLQKMAEDNKVDVEFYGPRPHEDLAELLREGDIFVLPTMNEGMSNSVLEAVATGLPVLMTKVGGSDELIQGNGWALEPGNVAELRSTLQEIREGKHDLVQMAKRSREIGEIMSWESVAEQYHQLFLESVKK